MYSCLCLILISFILFFFLSFFFFFFIKITRIKESPLCITDEPSLSQKDKDILSRLSGKYCFLSSKPDNFDNNDNNIKVENFTKTKVELYDKFLKIVDRFSAQEDSPEKSYLKTKKKKVWETLIATFICMRRLGVSKDITRMICNLVHENEIPRFEIASVSIDYRRVNLVLIDEHLLSLSELRAHKRICLLDDIKKIETALIRCYKRPRKRRGRPFNTDTESSLVAPSIVSSSWIKTSKKGILDEEKAKQYLEQGQAEHASIASFSVFSLQLVAVGAPMYLVEAAHKAALDEIRHAQIAFSLATRFGGKPVGPGALKEGFEIKVKPSLEYMVIATTKEACIGETMSCIEMARKNEKEKDLEIKEKFQTIIEDEIRHSALGWRTVRWAINQDERLIEKVKKELMKCEEIEPLMEWLFSEQGDEQLEKMIKKVIKRYDF